MSLEEQKHETKAKLVEHAIDSTTEFVHWVVDRGGEKILNNVFENAREGNWGAVSQGLKQMDQFDKYGDGAKFLHGLISAAGNAEAGVKSYKEFAAGDYKGAEMTIGSHVVDHFASKFLDGLGPEGIALNFLAHEGGYLISEYAIEKPTERNIESVKSAADRNQELGERRDHFVADLQGKVDYMIKNEHMSWGEVNQWLDEKFQHEEPRGLYHDIEQVSGPQNQINWENQMAQDKQMLQDRAYNEWKHLHEHDSSVHEQEMKAERNFEDTKKAESEYYHPSTSQKTEDSTGTSAENTHVHESGESNSSSEVASVQGEGLEDVHPEFEESTTSHESNDYETQHEG